MNVYNSINLSDILMKQSSFQQLESDAHALHRFKAIKEHLCSNLQGEAVVLSLKNGKYYGFNAVGASIWVAIQFPVTFQEIQTAILQEYDVSEELCAKEINSFLKHLVEEGLIDVTKP